MSNPNYTLEIISHHPTFKNKSLRKYYVEGIDTIGAWGDEPFEIKFTNHTYQKIQVKLSVDGTDLLTGDVADTEPNKDMWVVNGYGTLSLKAWPETNNGGAQLVFTSANNSVAVHTHGNLSSRGIIAAAVFTEGHVEPVRLNYPQYIYTTPVIVPTVTPVYPYGVYPTWGGGGTYGSSGISGSTGTIGGVYSNSVINNSNASGVGGVSYNSCEPNTFGDTLGSATMDCMELESDANAAPSGRRSKSLQSLAAVGAGQHVDQKITYVSGLIKPIFGETVRVRYLWWDDLVATLRSHNVPAPHASGFPGDVKQNIMSIGNTPRIGDFKKPAFPRERPAPVYSYLRV
jgi:hypothetical protein